MRREHCGPSHTFAGAALFFGMASEDPQADQADKTFNGATKAPVRHSQGGGLDDLSNSSIEYYFTSRAGSALKILRHPARIQTDRMADQMAAILPGWQRP